MVKHNELTKVMGDKLFEWFHARKQMNGKCTPSMSFSTNFRNA